MNKEPGRTIIRRNTRYVLSGVRLMVIRGDRWAVAEVCAVLSALLVFLSDERHVVSSLQTLLARANNVPNSSALATGVDLRAGALTLVQLAAGETVAQPRRPAVVGVVRRHVTAMTSGVRLHPARALQRARVAGQSLLRAPARTNNNNNRHCYLRRGSPVVIGVNSGE